MSYWAWGILVVVAIVVIFIARVTQRKLPSGFWRPGYSCGFAPGAWKRCDKREGADAGFPRAKDAERLKPLPGFKKHRQAPADRGRLVASGLPVLESTDDVLAWLGLDLRSFLALADPGDRIRPGKTNYVEWTVPKKRHGVRIICSPKPRLKAVQHRIKDEILDHIVPHEAAHGFVIGRSIVTNAEQHVGRALIVNLDLRNFFDYVRYHRVIGVFRWLGYSLQASRSLALLCTHRPNLSALHEDPPEAYVRHVFRHAVQGAPTSPALANLTVYRLDRRVAGLARTFDARYTRYADDLTFSGDEPFKRGMIRFLSLAKQIIAEEGFRLNMRKMRFMRPSQRQQVTGVIVNKKVNVRREDYDQLKAIVHNARKIGSLESQNRENHPDFRAHLLGRAAHIRQLNAARGQSLIDRIHAIA
ncbi:MAG: RNA-directed DNA polymerase [Phycisphaerae bacterium]|nr:RNA-directed DNA polymerase [Phycisphaerae bacterium]